jgi:hypothetical protein
LGYILGDFSQTHLVTLLLSPIPSSNHPLPFDASFFHRLVGWYSWKNLSPQDFGSGCHFDQGCQMVYFHTKKSQFGHILEGLGMENVGIFYDHLHVI